MAIGDCLAPRSGSNDLLGVRRSHVCKNLIINGNRGSVIAATETRNVANQKVLRFRIGEAALEIGAKFAGAVEMAAHIRTNADVDSRRWGEMKMRIKTGDAVNLIERGLRALRQTFKLRFREEAVAKLDSPEVVEDQGAVSRVKKRQTASNRGAWSKVECRIPCILMSKGRRVNSPSLSFGGTLRK
jgi:hypothetical protein